jgi:hypothetical protein
MDIEAAQQRNSGGSLMRIVRSALKLSHFTLLITADHGQQSRHLRRGNCCHCGFSARTIIDFVPRARDTAYAGLPPSKATAEAEAEAADAAKSASELDFFLRSTRSFAASDMSRRKLLSGRTTSS